MRKLGLGLALVVVSMNGCASMGGSGEPQAASDGYSGSATAVPAPVTVAEAAPAPPPAAAPAYGGSGGSSRSMEPSTASAPKSEASLRAPTERPGLGTEWGETRISRIHDVDFERADESRPFAVATLHYNDRRGVEALAAYHAWRGPRLREEPVVGGAITVSVRDSSNEPLEAIHLADRTYVIGEQGTRYAVVIENHSGHRFEAVTTVDGLDVMNGHAGSVENRGYVIDPYGSITIDGFRQSQASVAAFRFAKVADSYAAQTGTARNVGVIGVAFFDERGDAFARWSPEELRRRDTADPFPGNDHRYAQPPVVRW
jgi:hypothetical protein